MANSWNENDERSRQEKPKGAYDGLPSEETRPTLLSRLIGQTDRILGLAREKLASWRSDGDSSSSPHIDV